jgi:cytochrome b561
MSDSDRPVRYTTTAIALHWIIAVVVLGQVALGWWMQEIPKDPVGPRVNAFNLHKSIGLTILAAMPAWQARAARINHWLLYACLFLQPLSGYVGSAVSGYPVRYFGMLLPAWAAKSIPLKDFLSVVHLVSSWILVTAIAVHIAAALKHHVVERDGLLWRMWPRRPGPAATAGPRRAID